ncbi:MAG: deoxyribose-phosphate aldolase [Bdellovibrionota bacterium]
MEQGKNPEPSNLLWLAPLIDHTLLKPDSSEDQVRALCAEAKQYGFATVCVYAKFLPLCTELLAGTKVKSITVVGFPTGLNPTGDKTKETEAAIAGGAQEIDMVINTRDLQARKLHEVLSDIHAVVAVAQGRPVKVILETSLLSREEKILGCAQAKAGGAAFVKTSTGFSTGGATVEDVALLRKAVGPDMGVKASGGVRTIQDALLMVQAGANRIGTSAGVSILGGNAAKADVY